MAVTLATCALLATGGPAAAASTGPTFDGYAEDDVVGIDARDGYRAEQASEAQDPAVRLTEYMRGDLCAVTGPALTTPANGECATNVGAVQIPDCDGAPPLQPLWRRDRATPADPYGPWRFVASWHCPQDVLPAFTAEDFRRLPLAAPTLTLQPAAPTVLINVPTISLADAPEQLLTTDLLGYPIEVRATATEYTWDYGDGSDPLTTTGPGHPYPDHDVHHTYRQPGTYTITLTVTWSGEYRIAGSTTWQDVDGTATTTASAPPVTAVEARSHLVADPCTPVTC